MALLPAYIESVLSQRPTGFWPMGEPASVLPLDIVKNYRIAGSTGTINRRVPNGLAVGGFANDHAGGNFAIDDFADHRNPEFTLEAWINPDSISNFRGVLSHTDGNKPRPYDLYVVKNGEPAGGKLRLLIGNGSSNAVVSSTTTIPLGSWTHALAMSWTNTAGTGSHLAIYINGILEASTTAAFLPTGALVNTRIGNRNDGATPMDGQIAFPAIYDYPIDPGPVRERIAMARGIFRSAQPRALALR